MRNGSGIPHPEGRGQPWARRRAVFLALSSPLLILLALVALLLRPGSERVQALPALLIGCGLLATSWGRRRRRRHQLVQALRQKRQS